jgi:hypothetical protein
MVVELNLFLVSLILHTAGKAFPVRKILTYPLVSVPEPQATEERTTKQYNTATGEAEEN